MRFRVGHSPVVLLLLPAIANALSNPIQPRAAGAAVEGGDSEAAPLKDHSKSSNSPVVGANSKPDAPTFAAPVDGKDGKPHSGPFVSTDGVVSTGESHEGEIPHLKGRPDDPTMIDGKKIPTSNDGIMFDQNRERPQQGTTGTEGGISEKGKTNNAHELKQPEAPKAAPPLPHSEEEKLGKTTEKTTDKEKASDGDEIDYTGLDKPDDLPEVVRDKPPVPHSADKNHLDVHKPTDHNKPSSSQQGIEDDEGIIQPFHSFVLSLTMILVSEVGDKTFLVAALMAMKHDRAVVFSAAFGALLVMTVLSAVLGHAVPTLIPKRFTSLAAAGLFFVFGAKLLREGMNMDPNEGVTAELHEVEQELAEKEKELGRGRNGTLSADALEMGLNGRKSRSQGRFGSHRSPSSSPVRSSKSGGVGDALQGSSNLCGLLLSPAWVQTFVMTFLGEWGDRSQIATIAMAAGQDYWWVTLGATCGHAVCTGVAVVGGRAIAGRVSLKVGTY